MNTFSPVFFFFKSATLYSMDCSVCLYVSVPLSHADVEICKKQITSTITESTLLSDFGSGLVEAAALNLVRN